VSTPNDTFSKYFGERLKALRRGRSQASFARLLGIPNQQTYARYEAGERIPKASVLNQMAGALGVTVDELLRPSGEVRSPMTLKESEAPKYGSSLSSQIGQISQTLGIEESRVRDAIAKLLLDRNGGKQS
jgi:transcriptional regulator with XRE-family HTH domain